MTVPAVVAVGVTTSSRMITTALISLTKHHLTSTTTTRRRVVGTFPNPLRHRHRNLSASEVSPTPSTGKAEEVREWAGMLDIRVGRIVRAWNHPDADSLYVEEVDIGDEEEEEEEEESGGEKKRPSFRLICSGLVKYLPLPLLQDKKVVVLANLKPRNMRGVKSYGMLMAASDSSHENVELLEPPESSLPGDRIWFGDDVDIINGNLRDPASPNQIQKKKIWELVQPHLKTNTSCVAVLGDDVMRTSAGVVRCRSLKDANVS